MDPAAAAAAMASHSHQPAGEDATDDGGEDATGSDNGASGRIPYGTVIAAAIPVALAICWWPDPVKIAIIATMAAKIARMMIVLGQHGRVMFRMDAFPAPIHLSRRRGMLYESTRRKHG